MGYDAVVKKLWEEREGEGAMRWGKGLRPGHTKDCLWIEGVGQSWHTDKSIIKVMGEILC